jgi:hypothetical protein
VPSLARGGASTVVRQVGLGTGRCVDAGGRAGTRPRSSGAGVRGGAWAVGVARRRAAGSAQSNDVARLGRSHPRLVAGSAQRHGAAGVPARASATRPAGGVGVARRGRPVGRDADGQGGGARSMDRRTDGTTVSGSAAVYRSRRGVDVRARARRGEAAACVARGAATHRRGGSVGVRQVLADTGRRGTVGPYGSI